MTTDGEVQYKDSNELIKSRGYERMGLMTSWAWLDDPKRLAFMFARYKFVSKILAGTNRVLEVGCGDGVGARIVRQTVSSLTAIDFDNEFIKSALEIRSEKWPINFFVHNMLTSPFSGEFEGIYCLDVLEHIKKDEEGKFIINMITSLTPHGVVVIGMPSLSSQIYASAHSKIGHINCKDQPELNALMKKYFHNVFMFSMNDEVVHTGYYAMSHYNITVCVSKK